MNLSQQLPVARKFNLGKTARKWLFYSASLIYFYLNGGIISEIIPTFCNEILAGRSEMRWNLNEHQAESGFNLIERVPFAGGFLSRHCVFLFFPICPHAGCGLSLNLNASLTIISKYFLTKRPLANGLAMAGSPVFLCCLAPLNQYLLDKFGWRGSLCILGSLMLNCCVAGALMRPVALPRKPAASVLQKKPEEQPKYNNTKLRAGCVRNTKMFLDVSFFKDRGFVIYLIGNMMFIFGAYAPIVFLSAYAINQGVEEYSAAYLLSITGFVDMFVRPGTGLVANSKWIRPRIQYFFSFAMIFNGTSHLLCPLIKSYPFLVVYAVIFGIGFGMVFALIFECLMDLMGNQRFPSAVGLVTIIECFPMLLGPPAAGTWATNM